MSNDAQRQEYVNSLELADLPGHTPRPGRAAALTGSAPALQADEPQGFIDGGSVVCFVAGVSLQTRQDVLNSTLLAQLVANKTYDREVDTVGWYRTYREVLENIGWVVPGFNFAKNDGGGATFQVKAVVLKLLEAVTSSGALAVTKATLEAVEALGAGSDQLTLFAASSSSSTLASFQIGAVEEVDGVPTMGLGLFYLRSTNLDVNFLWSDLSTADTVMYQSAQQITLNQQVYKHVRQAIVDKLGSKALDYVKSLPNVDG